MKKTACILIALMMSLAFAVTALAADVSASYKNGTLTVSSSAGGYYTISVDGKGTERTLTPKSPSLSFSYPLEDGQHRVSIHNDVHGGGSTTIYIKNGVSVDEQEPVTDAPTQAPTAAPVVQPTATPAETAPTATPVPETEQTSGVTVILPAVEATCTKDGITEGVRDEYGRVIMSQQIIPALGHRYRVENSTKSTVTYTCVRCNKVLKLSPNEAVPNRYGNIVTGQNGGVLEYKAAPSKTDAGTIVLKLNQTAYAAVLTLDNSLIPQIIREGYTKVEIVGGDLDAVVELNKISRSWFAEKGVVEYYAFTMAKDGACKVEAKIAGTIVAADTFDGVTVK